MDLTRNYYRLKQVDLDGSYEYSKIVAVNFDLAETTVKVYPNPASTVLNFNGVGNKKGKIAWYNLSGQKIAETDLSNSQSTVPTSLNNGLYLIRVLFDDGSTFTQKISVVK